MASIESLPPDQRAVLQLVLQRGRSYDDIAQLLSIDRAAVGQRAHAALDALGPGTRVDADRRAQIADYLLGQQTEAEAAQTRERMAGSASERAWARVVASELTPFATGSLPEIPAEGAHEPPPAAAPAAPEAGAALAATQPPERAPDETPRTAEPAAAASGSATPPAGGGAGGDRPVSRRGGAILIAVAAAVVVVVVVIVLIANGGSSNSSSTSASTPATTPATTPTGSTASTGSTGSTGTTGSGAKVLAQFNLSSPTNKKTIGIAQFLQAGSQYGIAVVAENVEPNTKHNAYAVWLYNSPGQAELLGFVNPGVGWSGRLSTAGPLRARAPQYHELLVTLETQSKPKAPGTIVLQGQVTLSHSG